MSACIPVELVPQIEDLHHWRKEWAAANGERHLLRMEAAHNALRDITLDLTLDLADAGLKPKQIRRIVLCREGV